MTEYAKDVIEKKRRIEMQAEENAEIPADQKELLKNHDRNDLTNMSNIKPDF